jgi:hypothetical protein
MFLAPTIPSKIFIFPTKIKSFSDNNMSVVNKLQSNMIIPTTIFVGRKMFVFARGFVSRRKCWSKMTSFVVVGESKLKRD